MKPIYLTEDIKTQLLEKLFNKFKEEIDNYGFGSNDSSITIKTGFTEVAQDKVHIAYTQEAFLRMQALVEFFDTEVGWYGLVQKIDDKHYRVYDVKLCQQYVDGAKVDTTDEDTLEFFSSLTDDEADHMHFQAHSHVKMSTSASGVDIQNQQDVIKNMGKTGFYIFQIWNKNNDINTYLYDLDNNVFYDRKDVMIEIEDSLGTLDDFIFSIADLVTEKKNYYPYQYQKQYDKYSTPSKKTEKKDEKEHAYQNDYWDGTNYYGGWDWY